MRLLLIDQVGRPDLADRGDFAAAAITAVASVYRAALQPGDQPRAAGGHRHGRRSARHARRILAGKDDVAQGDQGDVAITGAPLSKRDGIARAILDSSCLLRMEQPLLHAFTVGIAIPALRASSKITISTS